MEGVGDVAGNPHDPISLIHTLLVLIQGDGQ